jgi:hypothetical protein
LEGIWIFHIVESYRLYLKTVVVSPPYKESHPIQLFQTKNNKKKVFGNA